MHEYLSGYALIPSSSQKDDSILKEFQWSIDE